MSTMRDHRRGERQDSTVWSGSTRFFTRHDNEHSSAVAVVDETFVHKFFPHTDLSASV
jgi:hypothetical protein